MKRLFKILFYLLAGTFLTLFFSCKDQVSGNSNEEPPVVVDTPLNPKSKIIKVTAKQSSGSYNAGEELEILVSFDEVVKVTGNPFIELLFNEGITRQAKYISGDNSSILTFSYKVQPWEFADKLAISSSAIQVGSSGSITNKEDEEVDLELPETGSAGAFDQQRNLKIGLSDNFNDNSFSTQWTFNDQDNYDLDQNGSVDDDIASSFFESSASGEGLLTLNGRGRDVWKNQNEFTSLYLDDLTDDFDFSVKISSRSVTHTWTKSGLMLANDQKDLSQSGIVFCSTTQSNKIAMQWDSNGDGKVNKSVHGVGSSRLPVWIRLRKTNNKVECFFKFSEGAGWSPHSAGAVEIQSGAGNFDVGIFSTSHNRFSNLTVQFDDFKDER